ncbi:hypothetical protein R1flu_014453 [Riccia fluitans]|uniref:Uncharacterized protein n=1 Tax=Riccia fluitans TaxID=41844 RepID=A0ABD1YJX6_9MARC
MGTSSQCITLPKRLPAVERARSAHKPEGDIPSLSDQKFELTARVSRTSKSVDDRLISMDMILFQLNI